MTDTDDVLNQALAGIDAEDADIAAANDDKGEGDDKETENAGTGKPAAIKDDAKSTDSGDDEENDATKESPDKAAKAAGDDEELPEGEFTADDALEVEEAPTPAAANAPVDQAGVVLSDAEREYVVDNIGDPVTLNGYKLDKDGNQVEYQVKAYGANNIPADFNFQSEADRVQATDAFNKMEVKANNLLQDKRQQQTRAQALEYERAENEMIRSDVAELQKEGRMAKFRVKPGDVGFDEDPAANIVTDVLKVMHERNQKYLEDHNTKNAAYRHIGFSEAYDIWERKNPQRIAAKQRDTDQAAEDKARKGKAERGDSNRGEVPPNIMKATVRSGTTNRDIIAMIDNDEI